MKTLRYFLCMVAMLLLALAETSCSDSDVFNNIANKVTHTATMTLSGSVRGFEDSRADADGWSDGDRLYLNFTTASGVVAGTAIYNKAVDAWSLTYSGSLTEGAVTQCEVYYFDGADTADENEAKFNNNTIVYADSKALYVCKEGAISLTAMLVPQTARFRFKGTPGTTFNVSGYDFYTGYSSQSLQKSTANVRTTIADDGYSPYIYGFVGNESRTLVVTNGEYEYHRAVERSTFAAGKTGRFTLPDIDTFDGWEKRDGEYKIFTVNGVSFKMIRVNAGTFTMGATEEQTAVEGNEEPAHQVTLTKDYYMGETEVTQALWYAVMGQKPTSDGNQWYDSKGLGDNYPAYYISWNDCQEFISKLNQLTGLTFRLPTEAEWEYAARGGNKAATQTLYSGSNTIDDVAWYDDNSNDTTHPVASKASNALGIYDMSGNVLEWCYDDIRNYSRDAKTDPLGSIDKESSYRGVRGGSWCWSANSCRVASRSSIDTLSNSVLNVGLRLALPMYNGISSNYNTIELSSLGFENASTPTDITMSDGTVLTFGSGTNSNNAPKYYNATRGVRMYANNTLNVRASGKTMIGVKLTCQSDTDTDYVGNDTLNGVSGSTTVIPSISDATVSFGGFSGSELLITNYFAEALGSIQLRVQTITVYYAE